MKELFPSMCSKPEKYVILVMVPCWILIFVLIPMYMPILGLGLWEQWELSVWLEIGYHIVTSILMLLLIGSYLKEEWFMVTTAVSHYLKHVALTAGLMLGTELVLLGALFLCGFPAKVMLEGLPVVELSISHTPLFLLSLEPVWGTITLSVFVPISICALFYCFGFAPVCYHKPWLAYLCVAVVTLIPPVVDILWRGDAGFVLCCYLARLPIHLLACWSYQKTDNVWTPLFSVAVANLLMSAIQILLLH